MGKVPCLVCGTTLVEIVHRPGCSVARGELISYELSNQDLIRKLEMAVAGLKYAAHKLNSLSLFRDAEEIDETLTLARGINKSGS